MYAPTRTDCKVRGRHPATRVYPDTVTTLIAAPARADVT